VLFCVVTAIIVGITNNGYQETFLIRKYICEYLSFNMSGYKMGSLVETS